MLVASAVAVGAAFQAGGEAPAPRPPAPATAARTSPSPPAPPQLPRGGRSILPEHRVLAHYGAPQAAGLGILGIGTPAAAGARLRRRPPATPGRAAGRCCRRWS